MKDVERIRHLTNFFLQHKAKKQIPTWDSFEKTIRESSETVKRAYALAMLCKKNLYEGEITLPNELCDYRPFDADEDQTTPTMSKLMEWPGTLVLFPTSDEKKAHCIMMFVFRPPKDTSYRDNRDQLCDNTIIAKEYLVYLIKEFVPMKECLSRLDGNSWQLAYALAEKSLKYDQDGCANKQKLLNWLITGALDPQKETVRYVNIGFKPDLLTPYRGLLKLLAPLTNEPELEQLERVQYQVTDSVAQAWRIVTRTGFEIGEIHLPDPVEELHVLIGGNIQHLLYVIFRLAPKKTVLWHSKDTAEHATIIIRLFEKLHECGLVDVDEFKDIQKREIDSHNMQESYESIRKAVDECSEKKHSVINNTGGNRLMGFAALLAARDLGVPVVYRDIDSPDDTMTGIKYEKGNNLIGDIHGINRWPGNASVDWSIFGKSNSTPCFPKKDYYMLPQTERDLKRDKIVNEIKEAVFSL